MKRFLIIILPCLLALWSNAQVSSDWRLRWAVHPAMTGLSDVRGAVLDSLGNYILVGIIRGSGNFDTRGGTNILSTPRNDPSSGVIWKLDTAGKSIWAKQLSIERNSEAWDVETDRVGNLFVSGEFTGEFDADPGPNLLPFTSDTSGKGHFIIKLDPKGDLIWAKNLPGHVKPSRLSMDPRGRLVIGGSFNGPVDVDPGPASHILDNPVPGPWENMLAMVWDSDGNFIWASAAGGNRESIVTGICADLSGNVLATGSFGGDTDFDPGPGQFILSGRQKNGFVWKLDPDGVFIWAVPFIAQNDQLELTGTAIVVDPTGDPIMVGSYSGRPDIDPGPGVQTLYAYGEKDIFVVKMDRNGGLVWAKDFGGPNLDVPYDLTLDQDGNILVTGSFTWWMNLDGTGVTPDLVADSYIGNVNSFIFGLYPDGQYFTGLQQGAESGGKDAGQSILTQGYFVFRAGRLGYRMDMDPKDPLLLFNPDLKTSPQDIFIQKLYLCLSETYRDTTITSCGPYTINDSTYTKSGRYLQTLTNARGCDSILTIHLTVIPLPHPDLGPDRFLCASGVLSLDPGVFDSYVWQDGTNFASIEPSVAGSYSVTVTDAAGCAASDTVVIRGIGVPPSGFLPRDTVVCAYDQVVLRTREAFQGYTWSDGSTAPTMVAPGPGLYWLEATDANGCVGRDSIQVGDKDCPPEGFHAPTGFTPNGDGLNDVFRPIIWGTVGTYSLRVFDRWGVQVYMTTDRYAGWDGRIKGTPAPTGTFTWVCRFSMNGAAVRTEKGTVVLIR